MPIYTNNATLGTGSSTEVIPADKFGKGFHVQNEGSTAAYLKFGADASSGDYDYKIEANSWFELRKEDIPKGRIDDGGTIREPSINMIAASGTPRVNAISFY